MLKVHSSLTKPSTRTIAISTSLMNSKSLWLRNGDQETLHHILVKGLRSFSSCKTGLELCPIIILEKNTCKSKDHFPRLTHHARGTKVSLQHN
jgi:hypothetical protein